MANLTNKYTQMLERLKGVNKPAQALMSKAAMEEQRLAQMVAKLTKEAELAKVASGINEPLKVNPFESALKDFKPANPKQIELKPINDASLGDVIPDPQTQQFESHLGDVVPDAPNPKGWERKELHSGAPEFNEPTVESKAQSTLDLDQDAMGIGGAPKDVGYWQSLKDKLMGNKGKVAAGLALGGAATYNGYQLPKEDVAASKEVGTQITADQPIPAEVKELPSEEEKELGRQINTLSVESKGSASDKNSKPSAEEMLKVIQFGGDSVASGKKLADAQRKAHIFDTLGSFQDLESTIGYDIAGIPRPQQLMNGDSLRSFAKGIVPSYQERVKFERQDPNSAQSQLQKSISKMLGADIQGVASADDLEKFNNGPLANIYNQKNASRERAEQNALNRQAQLEGLRYKAAMLKDQKSVESNNKDEDRLIKLNQQLNSPNMGSARNALGRNQLIINGADKIEALIKSAPNPDQLTGRQVYEIAKSLDGMLSMGSPTISGTEHLLPKTLMSQIAAGGEYMQNKPVGAQMGKFVNQMHHLIQREREVANGQITDFKQQFMGGLPGDFVTRRKKDIDNMMKVHGKSGGIQNTVPIKPEDVDNLSDEEVEKELKARGI